ncbi:enoyl-CoA hydratase/isomerase domain-containing protein [Ditylenchus destructor]|uniref:Enoyl-CoA hydratase/isomerase domain-containing protein n=1 Tax=Ditylenchus destructor TaxID=166010 RepID=A0AAD4MHG4_9BILA|nr:enoyl-CoA hydratase/isomerase domain-containing protein [Ditylenchus destructor]
MYAELADALANAETDAAVRCVLIQGDPTIFSAGNDIGDFLNAPPATQESPCSASCAASPLPQAARRVGVRSGRGHRHHDAVPLRPGLCRRQRGLLDALREPGPVPRGGFEPAGAADAGLPPRRRGAAAGRTLHGRGRARSGPGQPRGAADRGERHRADPGPQAGGQAAERAGGNQAPAEEGPDARRAGAHGRGGRELRAHAARTGCAGGVQRFYGKAQAGFQQVLKSDASPEA